MPKGQKNTFRFTGFRGLAASVNVFDQPQGTLSRLSNLMLTERGGLTTVDGSHVICAPPPVPPSALTLFVIGGNGASGVDGTGGIFRTNDLTGATWEDVTPANFVSSAGPSFPFSFPGTGSDIYWDIGADGQQMVAAGNRIDWSDDGGRTWHPSNITSWGDFIVYGFFAGSDAYTNRSIAFGRDTVVVAGSNVNTGNPAVAVANRSDLSTWTIVDFGALIKPDTFPIGSGGCGGIAARPDSPRFVVQLVSDAVLVHSNDGGLTWEVAFEDEANSGGVFTSMSFAQFFFLTMGISSFSPPPNMISATSGSGFIGSWAEHNLGTQYVDSPHLPDFGQNPDGIGFDEDSGLWVALEDGRNHFWSTADPLSYPWTKTALGNVGGLWYAKAGANYYLLSDRGGVWSASNPAGPWTQKHVEDTIPSLGISYGTDEGIISVGVPATTGASGNQVGFVSTDGGVTWTSLPSPIEPWIEANGMMTARTFMV